MTGKEPKPPSTPAARKAKPRDLAEEHKPSRKVALNEVLRSLQDLVNNELAVVPPKTPATTESPAPEPAATDTPPPVAVETPVTPPQPVVSSEPEPPALVVPPEGLQQELPLAVAPPAPLAIEEPLTPIESAPSPIAPAPPGPAAPSIPEPPAPVEPPASSLLVETEAEPSELPPLEPLGEDDTATPGGIIPPAEQGDLSEIPVLEDIIDFHDEAEPRVGGAVPPAAEGRRLAIQVAARLNVELRKAGKPSLASDVITRLARLLEEALAKAGTNMENKPPEKH